MIAGGFPNVCHLSITQFMELIHYPLQSYVYSSLETLHMAASPGELNVKILNDSMKFYLPGVEGYLEIVRNMASRYGGMSLIEFDGYFEGKFEPVKYAKVEIHTNDID
jgi:hypothetical protein